MRFDLPVCADLDPEDSGPKLPMDRMPDNAFRRASQSPKASTKSRATVKFGAATSKTLTRQPARGAMPRSASARFCLQSSLARASKRVMGIEPTLPAWKAGTLPLSYTRSSLRPNRSRSRMNAPQAGKSPANVAVRPFQSCVKMGDVGFEPTKAEPPDLQSGPFDHSGNPPFCFASTQNTAPALPLRRLERDGLSTVRPPTFNRIHRSRSAFGHRPVDST